MTWQPYGRKHALAGSFVHCDIEHPENDEYTWRWRIWVSVRGQMVLLHAGTHNGTEIGAKRAVGDALRVAAQNLSSDAARASVVYETNGADMAPAPEVG